MTTYTITMLRIDDKVPCAGFLKQRYSGVILDEAIEVLVNHSLQSPVLQLEMVAEGVK